MNKAIRVAAIRILALVLSVLLLLSSSGCLSMMLAQVFEDQQESATGQQATVFEADGDYNDLNFDELCDVLFAHEVDGDNLYLNQLVSDPEALGLEATRPASLGQYSYEATHADNQFYAEVLEALTGDHAIKPAQLSKSQRLEAEYIERVLQNELEYDQYFHYLEPLSPSTGAHAWIPLSLMDYRFRTVDDVDIYLELLEDVPRYFSELLAFEGEKKDLGLLMPQESITDTIDEASAYTEGVESNVLVASFDEMLDDAVAGSARSDAAGVGQAGSDTATEGLAGLTEAEVQQYKQRNREYVRDFVIPAYKQLIAGLEALAPSCQAGVRVCDYPLGTDFYELRMRSMGFAEGATSAVNTLETALEEYRNTIADGASSVDWDSIIPESVVRAIGEDPQDYIAYIEEHSAREFAGAGTLDYTVKVAPDASPNDYAMAYFLVPPVDDTNNNIIVLFPRNIADDVEFFSTMAHEGYPGHMYQFYAYSLEGPTNISKVLGSSAYAEGWAMYAQARAMMYLDADPGAIEVYNAYEKFVYGLQARVDLGINYEGWSLSDTERYLSNWGYEDAAESLYTVSIQQPVSYLPYGLGVIEFDSLRQQAEARLQKGFDPIEYHQAIMSLGGMPFDILEREFESWLISAEASSPEQKSGTQQA